MGTEVLYKNLQEWEEMAIHHGYHVMTCVTPVSSLFLQTHTELLVV